MEELLLSKSECNTIYCTLADQVNRFEIELKEVTDPEDKEFYEIELEKTKLLLEKFEKYS